jgi:hypothetical protein
VTTLIHLLSDAIVGERLRAARVARVGFVDGGQPVILPVNVAVDAALRISYRTTADGPLAALDGQRVAVEIDGVDVDTRSGWSILVLGVAHDVSMGTSAAADIDSWAPGHRTRTITIVPHSIGGRDIPPGDDADWYPGVPGS